MASHRVSAQRLSNILGAEDLTKQSLLSGTQTPKTDSRRNKRLRRSEQGMMSGNGPPWSKQLQVHGVQQMVIWPAFLAGACSGLPVFHLQPGHVAQVGRACDTPEVVDAAQLVVRPGGVQLQGIPPPHTQRCSAQAGHEYLAHTTRTPSRPCKSTDPSKQALIAAPVIRLSSGRKSCRVLGKI